MTEAETNIETEFEMPYENDEYTKYNPLHKELGITLITNVKYEKRLTYNKYEIIDKNGVKKECFKKFITLVDYVKFLIGKYKNDNIQLLPSDEIVETTTDTLTDTTQPGSLFKEYINSYHNYAYVDGFFYYLSSTLLEKGFVHGLDFYDSYVCITKQCEIDIVDDFEYLCDSNYFSEKLNNQFYFKDENLGDFFNKKEPIVISDKNEEIAFEVENLDDFETEPENELEPLINDIEELDADVHQDSDSDIDSDIENSEDESDDSDGFSTDNDTKESDSDNESNDSETDDSKKSDDSKSENGVEKLTLVIKKIPTQVVAIEKCEGTFDSLLEDNLLTIEELESAIFQIILILYVYQNKFDFTHNDLHTNNVMYIYTDEPFMYYKIKDTFYKIPTFGKIYKIIDFGRSIYKVNNKIICSDSFSPNGTAHTQYNFEPFYNKNKQIVLPNKSFDLCRLACSMIDFIIDDIKEINKFKEVPIYDLIISWLYDDNGKNVLYKSNGEERYPDFKLYKMIARIVHNHIPEKQFEHACFNKYKTSSIEKYINIDEF
uniref:Protein kinase domain-containing protein n=1 Tax=viral metagenome TaxID=1070528 RepID=A0A6C0D2V8_9ZZZZ